MARPSELLVVEDSPDDLFFLERLFARAGRVPALTTVTTGRDAIETLRARHAAGQLPRAVLLDLKLPLISGFEVLEWIRGTAGLKDLPVIVLSSSEEPRDVERARELRAQGYLIKMPNVDTLRRVLKALDDPDWPGSSSEAGLPFAT